MRKAAVILIVAFLYALTSLLGFSLAAANSLISPVWPPAGIALAAVLIFGNISLFGIFIGCYVANAHMFLNGSTARFINNILLSRIINASTAGLLFLYIPQCGQGLSFGKSFILILLLLNFLYNKLLAVIQALGHSFCR